MTAILVLSSALNALSDPADSSSLGTGALWIQQTLLGTVATSIAVVSVASIGFLMMTGRVNIRRGATVVIGCFILFGAPTIAAGLFTLSQGIVAVPEEVRVVPEVQPPAPVPSPPQSSYDPYAGAAVPQH